MSVSVLQKVIQTLTEELEKNKQLAHDWKIKYLMSVYQPNPQGQPCASFFCILSDFFAECLPSFLLPLILSRYHAAFNLAALAEAGVPTSAPSVCLSYLLLPYLRSLAISAAPSFHRGSVDLLAADDRQVP